MVKELVHKRNKIKDVFEETFGCLEPFCALLSSSISVCLEQQAF